MEEKWKESEKLQNAFQEENNTLKVDRETSERNLQNATQKINELELQLATATDNASQQDIFMQMVEEQERLIADITLKEFEISKLKKRLPPADDDIVDGLRREIRRRVDDIMKLG